ncbi:MAG: hypothetical protein D3X82_07905 [Candidatus Leucobacter sulfamidivorax]|nr:hypothetical protein [Candidatus Leucobacter sulfamidivorax]
MKHQSSARLARVWKAGIVAAALVVSVSACATGGDGGGGEPQGSTTGPVQSAELDALYAGAFTDPPSEGPVAQTGKNVWYISCGESFAACSSSSAAFKEAGEVLGWEVTVFDGATDPGTTANGIEQAIAAGADGIAILATDCSLIAGALQQAKDADIPVVNAQGLDCDTPLFTESVSVAGTPDFCGFYEEWGRQKAVYVEGAGLGEAVLDLHETSQELQRCVHDGFVERLAECEDCNIVADVPWSFATIGDLGSIVSSALLANPSATAINVSADTLIPAFVGPAVQEQGLAGSLAIIGGEGYDANLELIRSGLQPVSIAFSFPWIAWGQADALNRVFADGADVVQPDQGGGFQAIDIDHNLPAEGESWEPPVDFRAAYTQIWKG